MSDYRTDPDVAKALAAMAARVAALEARSAIPKIGAIAASVGKSLNAGVGSFVGNGTAAVGGGGYAHGLGVAPLAYMAIPLGWQGFCTAQGGSTTANMKIDFGLPAGVFTNATNFFFYFVAVG